MSGSVAEAETDIRLPGPTGVFTLHRTYNGALDDEGALGSNWFANTNNAFIKQNGSGYLLIETASSTVPFTSNGMGGFNGPDYSTLELTTGNAELIITNARTGMVWVFHAHSISNSDLRGKLKEATTQQWRAEGKTGTVFAYNQGGDFITVTTAGDQAYRIVYGRAGGRITSLTVSKEVSTNTYEDYRILTYTYFASGTHNSAVGEVGDLVQVKNSFKMDDGNWVDRYTQYRYGVDGKIKGVFHNGSIQRLLDLDTGLSTPDDILEEADSYDLSGSTSSLSELADRWFEYYSTNADTTDLVTPWDAGGENLERYLPTPASSGDYNRDETGFVKSERIATAGCSTCGSAVIRHFAYLELDQGQTSDDNEVKYLVIEDTEDAAHNKIQRSVAGLNARGKKLRGAVTYDPTVTTPKFWCRSWRLATPTEYSGSNSLKRNLIMEYRLPSAHKDPGSIDLKKFFDPYDDGVGGWANDEAVLKVATDSGCGSTFTYAYNSSGSLTEARVKRGRNASSAYLLRAREYGDGNTVPAHEPTKIYTYPTKETTVANGEYTQFAYTYWDTEKTQVQSVTTTKPIVSSGNNGSDQAASSIVYYDKAGRMRWAVDELGYVSYYSYDKHSGQLGFAANDVNPSSLPTDATSTHLVSKDDDGDTNGSYDSLGVPSYDSQNMPTPLNRSVLMTYDEQGRHVSTKPSAGPRSAVVYESNRTIYFNGIDTSGNPVAPIVVSAFDEEGKLTEEYSVRANYSSASIANNLPIGFSTEPSQDDYVSWTRYTYSDSTGALLFVDRYHDIPSTTTGDISVNFQRTGFRYDSQGRREYAITQISGDPTASDGVEFVVQTQYDEAGRVHAMRRGVSDASHPIGGDYSSAGSTPTLTTVSEQFYDGATGVTAADLEVGDGHMTQSKTYHTVDSMGAVVDYTLIKYHYDYRGNLRGSERFYNGSTAGDSVGPYSVVDHDWEGRAIATAVYDAVPNWSTITSGDGDGEYAVTTVTDRRELSRTKYDEAGQVYRTEQSVINESDGSVAGVIRTDNYYNLRGEMVASEDKYGVSQEYAYDGLRRNYQTRTVKELKATKFSSGEFQYRSPVPDSNFSTMSNGDDGVITLSHSEYDVDSDKVITKHFVDLNHDDSDGISLSSGTPSGGVRDTTHLYYNDLGMLQTIVSYGAADHDDGNVAWKASGLPNRDTGTSTGFASNANRLVIQYGYEAETLRLETNSDTAGVVTKTFYDDLGRRVFVIENYDDASFVDPPTGLGGGTDGDKDRAMKWVYNAGGQLTDLIAFNGSSETQATAYSYDDAFSPSLVTKTTYPSDSSPKPCAESTYNLDGSIASSTDQRGVVIEYNYDDSRRPILKAATTIPSGVDTAVKSIGRTYDSLGRVEKVTSYSDTAGSSAVNEIRYTYDPDHGLVTKIEQNHTGAVIANGTEEVTYTYDESVANGVYDDGLRPTLIYYPAVGGGCREEFYYGASGSLNDRLGRPVYDKLHDGGLRTGTYAHTIRPYLTGAGLMARLWSESGATGFNTALDYSGGGGYSGWDRFGRVIRNEWKQSTTTVDKFEYAYDYAGNRTERNTITSTNDTHDQLYTYDGLNRLRTYDQGTLTSGSIGSSTEQRYWNLDQLGNWDELRSGLTNSGALIEDRAHNEVNELIGFATPSSFADPVHDAAGNMTTIPKPIDLTESYTGVYDAWNRLVRLEDAGVPVQWFEYDGLGQRIARKDPDTTNPYTVGAETHFYYNDRWQVLAEANESGDAMAIYLYRPDYIDAIAVRMTAIAHQSGESEHFYLTDAFHNVTGLLERGGGSTVVERYAYSPYGEFTVLDTDYSVDFDNKSDVDNEYLYTGRRTDPRSGLQTNRNRYYHQQLGRWVNRDPIGYGGGINLYEYAASNPASLRDPMGQNPVVLAPAAAEAIAAAAGMTLLACLSDPHCKGLLEKAIKTGVQGLDAAKRLAAALKCAATNTAYHLLEDTCGKCNRGAACTLGERLSRCTHALINMGCHASAAHMRLQNYLDGCDLIQGSKVDHPNAILERFRAAEKCLHSAENNCYER